MITEETISRVKSSLQATKSFLALEVIEQLEKENVELKEQNKTILEDNDTLNKWIDELKAQIENYKLSENESKEIIAELKENHESDKRSLSLIIDKGLKLEAQIEKMKCFIHSEIDFCTYCPLTNECENEEGTCPYGYATEEEQKNLLMDFIQKWELGE